MKALLLAAITLSLAACSTPLAQRAQRAEGLLDFLAGNPGEIAVPIETADDGNGRIEAAHVRLHGGVAWVTGFVRRSSFVDPRASAHVDVLVVDARKHILERTVATYLPRAIPHGQRGGFAHSHFTVRLATLPPPGATVQVRFHDGSRRSHFVAAAAPQPNRL